MLDSMSLAFLFGLFIGLILGYFIRDIFSFMARILRRVFFRPTMLTPSSMEKKK